ncbi:MAG: phosphoribosylglycinamide formyltransferase 1 [Candidatus Cloacimonadota bacterium]|jgi:phosphoribosylglycinamide formyltransferase-1|nr:phosphoribosylglycinamide formyltransferase 1 [Candidatus Cloacimonadota bacterium]
MKKRLAIMISGRGSNMLAIAKNVQAGILQNIAEIAVVFSNKKNAPGLQKAKEMGLETAVIPSYKKQRSQFDKEVAELLQQYKPNLVVLAGYMRVLSPEFVEKFKIVNIHPADTKQHRGLGGYKWAWQNKLPQTKITVHYVDAGLDTGKIIAQKTVNLQGATSLADVEKRGLAVEHEFYSEIIKQICEHEDKDG